MSSDANAARIKAVKESGGVMTHRQILFVIYGLMAGMFLSALDQTVVGSAIRTIGDDLHGLSQQAWVTTAYLIVSTIATPIYGKLSDIFGRRPLYMFGIAVFIIGSLLSSFSTSMIELAAFRAFQGIGAGEQSADEGSDDRGDAEHGEEVALVLRPLTRREDVAHDGERQ